MPARKSDARKSDVSQPADVQSSNSNARCALKDDYQEPPSQAPAPAPAPAPASAPQPDTALTTKHASPPLAKMSHPTAAAAAAAASAAPAQQQQQQQPQGDETEDEQQQQDKKQEASSAVSIEDLTLPKSIITRLAKGVLPANTQIQANAVLAMSKSTTVFVNYLASSANDHTTSMGKKTISPADVFKALEDVEFGFLKERLEAEYNKFNQIQTEKRTSYRAKVKAAKSGPADAPQAGASGEDISMADTSTAAAQEAADDAHRSKKARVDPNATVSTVEHDDAETEDEEPQNGEDEAEQDEDDDAEEEGAQSEEDETQEDRLEERVRVEERDEALDGDDSD